MDKETKTKLFNEYIVRFCKTTLSKSTYINEKVNLQFSWNYICLDIKNKSLEEKNRIKQDILMILTHDNFLKVPSNFKGHKIRYLVMKKIIDECYI